MEIARQGSTRLQHGQSAVGLDAPVRLRFTFGLLVIMLALVAGVTRLARNDAVVPDLFAAYANIWPGQSLDRNLLEEFSCVTTPGSDQTQAIYCQRYLKTDAFSHIGLIISSDRVSHLDLIVHQNALNVGDLAMLWGRPEVYLYGNSMSVAWPDRGIIAMGWSDNERFSYLLPLWHISFFTVRPS